MPFVVFYNNGSPTGFNTDHIVTLAPAYSQPTTQSGTQTRTVICTVTDTDSSWHAVDEAFEDVLMVLVAVTGSPEPAPLRTRPDDPPTPGFAPSHFRKELDRLDELVAEKEAEIEALHQDMAGPDI